MKQRIEEQLRKQAEFERLVNEREAAAVVKTPSTIPTFDGEPCKLFITN